MHLFNGKFFLQDERQVEQSAKISNFFMINFLKLWRLKTDSTMSFRFSNHIFVKISSRLYLEFFIDWFLAQENRSEFLKGQDLRVGDIFLHTI